MSFTSLLFYSAASNSSSDILSNFSTFDTTSSISVYKDNATGTWRVIYRFANWKGKRKQMQKRGFATKREALIWEHEVMLKQNSKPDMTFASFFELYEADKKQRVKESTWESKSHVIRTKMREKSKTIDWENHNSSAGCVSGIFKCF